MIDTYLHVKLKKIIFESLLHYLLPPPPKANTFDPVDLCSEWWLKKTNPILINSAQVYDKDVHYLRVFLALSWQPFFKISNRCLEPQDS